MNIIEKYIEEKNGLIILISGFSGSGKTILAKSLAKDLKVEYINLNDYYFEDYSGSKMVGNIKVIEWDSPDAINWDKFNEKIKEIKKSGVVVSGFIFPEEKIKFTPDYHIHFKISKDDLIKVRSEYTSEREDSKLKDLEPDIEKRILNAISFPIYLEQLKNQKFTKTINIQYGELKKAYDELFDYVIYSIKKII
jgi:uridine kinase